MSDFDIQIFFGRNGRRLWLAFALPLVQVFEAVLPDFVAAFEQSSAVSIGNEKAVLVPLQEEAILMWFHDTPPF